MRPQGMAVGRVALLTILFLRIGQENSRSGEPSAPRSRRLGWKTKVAVFAGLVASLPSTGVAQIVDFEGEPIRYGKTQVDDAVARLQQRLDQGLVRLERDSEQGYLPSVLRELKIPVSSPVLVFSKTSFQRELISPQSPRAIYSMGMPTWAGYVAAR